MGSDCIGHGQRHGTGMGLGGEHCMIPRAVLFFVSCSCMGNGGVPAWAGFIDTADQISNFFSFTGSSSLEAVRPVVDNGLDGKVKESRTSMVKPKSERHTKASRALSIPWFEARYVRRHNHQQPSTTISNHQFSSILHNLTLAPHRLPLLRPWQGGMASP